MKKKKGLKKKELKAKAMFKHIKLTKMAQKTLQKTDVRFDKEESYIKKSQHMFK